MQNKKKNGHLKVTIFLWLRSSNISLLGNPRFSDAHFICCLPLRENYNFPDPFRVRSVSLVKLKLLSNDSNFSLAPELGLEPRTSSLTARRSTIELLRIIIAKLVIYFNILTKSSALHITRYKIISNSHTIFSLVRVFSVFARIWLQFGEFVHV